MGVEGDSLTRVPTGAPSATGWQSQSGRGRTRGQGWVDTSPALILLCQGPALDAVHALSRQRGRRAPQAPKL